MLLEAIVRILVALAGIDADSERLRATAPSYLTSEQAVEHLWTARVAAWKVGVDASLLLSIAWHESRYSHAAVGPESGGRVSCGVMTPEPVARCRASTTLLDEYVEGAEHLHGWVVASRGDLHRALLGYAGGGRLILACQSGPVVIRKNVDACQTPSVFLNRAATIRSVKGSSV